MLPLPISFQYFLLFTFSWQNVLDLFISYLSFCCYIRAPPNFITIINSGSCRPRNAPCSPSVAVVTRLLHGRLESACLIPGGGRIFVFVTASMAVLGPPCAAVLLVQGAVPRRQSSYPRHEDNHWPASSNGICGSLELNSKNRTRPILGCRGSPVQFWSYTFRCSLLPFEDFTSSLLLPLHRT